MVAGGVAPSHRTYQEDVRWPCATTVDNDVHALLKKGFGTMRIDHIDTPGPSLPWAGKQVRLEQVEEELAHLWRMSADNVRTSQNIHVRTSVLNLVICAPDVESARSAHALLRDLSSTHLARVILLILNIGDHASPGITSWVTLRSFPIISDIMRHSFEQITLLLTGSAANASANIIQSIIKPELPVYLWWLSDPPKEQAVFTRLLRLSSRIIVDSNSFFTPEQSIGNLLSLVQSSPECALSDLNWGRITHWRELIAQFFDMPEYKPYIAGVDTVEIEHAVTPLAEQTLPEQDDVSANPTRALLLAGWLKTSLGWKLAHDAPGNVSNSATGTHTWQIARPLPLRQSSPTQHNTSTTLHLRPRVQSDLRPGSICLVRLTSTLDDGKHATFTINREDDLNHVLTSVELAEGTRPQRTVSMAAIHKESELLHDELEIMGHDYLYENTLHEVSELLAEPS